MNKDKRLYWLLTGGTGLVGQYLLRDLTLANQRLAVVVRDGRRESAAVRVERIMQMWEAKVGKSLARPVVLTGDVTQPWLGLSDDQRDWAREHCDRVIHNAATLTFHPTSDGEPFRTNVQGTRYVMDLVRHIAPEQFHYVSTAYVCGKREGVIYEDEFDDRQGFRNAYERSKFEAERIVRETAGPWSTTIFRPAVIGGDSTTGYTATYHGIFMYLRLLATLVPQQERDENGIIQTPIQLPMTGDEKRNLVPVEWVTQVMQRILLDPRTHGRTYHLVPDEPITPRRLIDACCQYFHSDGVVYCGPDMPRRPDNDFAARYFESARAYEDYEQCDPTFDCRHLKEVAGDIPCPEITEEVVLRYMEYGVQDRWGKRKAKPVQVPDVARQMPAALEAAVESFRQNAASPVHNHQHIGVAMIGPGGGDFTLDLGTGALTQGIRCDVPRLTIDTQRVVEFWSSLDSQEGDAQDAAPTRDAKPGPPSALVKWIHGLLAAWYAGGHLDAVAHDPPAVQITEPG